MVTIQFTPDPRDVIQARRDRLGRLLLIPMVLVILALLYIGGAF